MPRHDHRVPFAVLARRREEFPGAGGVFRSQPAVSQRSTLGTPVGRPVNRAHGAVTAQGEEFYSGLRHWRRQRLEGTWRTGPRAGIPPGHDTTGHFRAACAPLHRTMPRTRWSSHGSSDAIAGSVRASWTGLVTPPQNHPTERALFGAVVRGAEALPATAGEVGWPIFPAAMC
jgi:hypothetical protein